MNANNFYTNFFIVLSLLLVLVPSLFFNVKAQEIPPPETLHPMRPSAAIILAILASMFAVTFILIVYVKYCHNSPLELLNNNLQDQNNLHQPGSRFSGIDRKVIESLPFFMFSSLQGSRQGLECAICISKFEDSETLRLLPKCGHAFHINCIDQWLQSHSSCPICRNRVEAEDLKDLSNSNSLRLILNPSNLSDDPNLEIFVQREQDLLQGSPRFNIGSSFRKILNRGKKDEESLIVIDKRRDGKKLLHKFSHKIIVSDVVVKRRWSDVNSSDMITLSSEMLGDMSSKRFSPSSEQNKFEMLCEESSTRMLTPSEKRSMSEITNVSRFREMNMKPSSKDNVEEDRVRKIWLPIARRTVQWFAGRERNTQEPGYKQTA